MRGVLHSVADDLGAEAWLPLFAADGLARLERSLELHALFEQHLAARQPPDVSSAPPGASTQPDHP